MDGARAVALRGPRCARIENAAPSAYRPARPSSRASFIAARQCMATICSLHRN